MITLQERINTSLANHNSVRFRFLTSAEQALLPRSNDIHLDGGYPEAERKRLYINIEPQHDIVCLKITYNDRYVTLRHQNILGSLMALSITRDSIGDILPRQQVFFITSEMKAEILRSFTHIGTVPITLEEIHPVNVVAEQEYEPLSMTSASLRIDLIVARITKQSRQEASMLIQQELVRLNHQTTTKSTKIIDAGDVISIRHYGRFIIDDTSQRSKKGKIIVKYRKFV